jgi:transcriptional regulator with XRE-family HTH domain
MSDSFGLPLHETVGSELMCLIWNKPPSPHIEPIPMRIGQKIRELREAKSLTPGQLAKACGLAVFYIHDFENGFNLPTYSSLFKLAPALGVDVKVLDACEHVQVEGVEHWKYVPEVEEKVPKKVEVRKVGGVKSVAVVEKPTVAE